MSIRIHIPTANVITFTIAGEPVSKARARFTGYGSKTRTYTPEKTLTAEARVRAAYLQAAKPCDDKDAAFRVEAHFYAGTRQRRDVDNMVKLVLDALNKIAFPDDVQVLELVASKSFVPKGEARTEVSVSQIGSMNPPTKPCEHCGEAFRTYDSWKSKTYCSRDCQLAKRRLARIRTCEVCDKKWDPGKPSVARFCSLDCKRTNDRVDIDCDHCGGQFRRQRCFLRPKNYCSDECSYAAARPRRLAGSLGVCSDCAGPTSKKSYIRCRACNSKARAANTKRRQRAVSPVKEIS